MTPSSHPAPHTLLVTATGSDRKGVTSSLFDVIERSRSEVLDLEQVVVRGHLTLAFLLSGWDDLRTLRADLHRVGATLGMDVATEEGTGDSKRRKKGRAAVVVLGAPLLATHVAAVTREIAAHGANIDRIRRLSHYPVTTVEFDVSGAAVKKLRQSLALTAAEHAMDVAVAPGGLARRGRRLVVMDVDSTLIQDEVIELLATHAGSITDVARVTEAAMRGELDFGQSLHARVATLAGTPASVLEEVRQSVKLTPGARTLVRTMKRLGFTVALVSGGFIQIVGPLARELEIDFAEANDLEIVDGVLTGRILGDVVDRAGKAAALRRFAARSGLPMSRTVAIGDGANDLDMLAAAGLGIAFNAKPVVREQADTTVNVPYLDAVLYLLGISREEIEEADESDGTPTPAPPLEPLVPRLNR